MKKYMIFMILCLCAQLYVMQAEAKVEQGNWQGDISWTYDTNTKVLVVTGSGEMEDNYYPYPDGQFEPGWMKYSKEIKRVIIQGEITGIGNELMEGFCNMTMLELPDSLRSIGSSAFAGAVKLKKVKLPTGLTYILRSAFLDSGLKEVTIPSGVKVVEPFAFSSIHLKEVTVSEGVEKLQDYCFFQCENLTKIKLPNSLKYIGVGCFSPISLKHVTIPKNVETIGDLAFTSCDSGRKDRLQKVVICSKKIKHWGDGIFGDKYTPPRKNLVIEVPKSKIRKYRKALYEKGLPEYVKVVGKKRLG